MAEDDRETSFSTSTVAADRARMQGLGVGARELAAQRDPMTTNGEQLAVQGDGQEGAPDPDADTPAGPPGGPDLAYDRRDRDEVSVTDPAGGAGAGI